MQQQVPDAPACLRMHSESCLLSWRHLMHNALQVSHYCSRECQVKDWKRGHREKCAGLAEKWRQLQVDLEAGRGEAAGGGS